MMGSTRGEDSSYENQRKRQRVWGESTSSNDQKVIADVLHGQLSLPRDISLLLDTAEFQRLKSLRQLGVSHHVFINANHTRFEHSLGVGFLAKKWMEHLQRNQPELCITPKDCKLVQIAGLCHDLGHGPFSHVWDRLLPRITPNYLSQSQVWNHEENSVRLLKRVTGRLDIGLSTADVDIIADMIKDLSADDIQKRDRNNSWKRNRFFYLIVNNFESGLDVDKIDYLRRDAHYTGLGGNNFDALIERSKVIECPDGIKRVCFHIDTVATIFDFFQTRFKMFDKIYTHKATKAIEYMIGDLFDLVADTFRFRGLKLHEACSSPDVFVHLYDSVLFLIGNHICSLNDQSPVKAKAKDLYERIVSRSNLYKDMGHCTLNLDELKTGMQMHPQAEFTEVHCNQFENQMYKFAAEEFVKSGKGGEFPARATELIKVGTVRIDYGRKDKNPVEMVYFFNKKNEVMRGDNEEIRTRLKCYLPAQFRETRLQVFCKVPKFLPEVSSAFLKWCKVNRQMEPISQANVAMDYESPTAHRGRGYDFSGIDENSDF